MFVVASGAIQRPAIAWIVGEKLESEVYVVPAPRAGVAPGWEESKIRDTMEIDLENCPHPEGLRMVVASGFRCPVCEARLDGAGVARWVREAETARDEAYSVIEGDEFARIVREARQREVYRRRKVMYDLQNAPWPSAAKPEMVLVIYDARRGRYDCRIFYKEPRPAIGTELVSVAAMEDEILNLLSHADPNVRLAAAKVEEFHTLRSKATEEEPAPVRRVFYASEL